MILIVHICPFFYFVAAVGFEPTISTSVVLSFTTKVRGLDRVSYPSFPAPRLADRIRSISS